MNLKSLIPSRIKPYLKERRYYLWKVQKQLRKLSVLPGITHEEPDLLGKGAHTEEREEFFHKFLKLGWLNDAEGKAIFDFLMKTREEVPPDGILLDLGAGQSRYKFFFDHCHYLAVDFGKGDAQWDYSALDFLADITNIGFIRDESINYCLNTTTLEHIAEPSAFFAEVRRVLEPGGKLYLYVPFVIGEHQEPYDFYRYTSYGLRHLSESNGLEVVSVDPSNGPVYTAIRYLDITLQQVRPPDPVTNKGLSNLKRIVRELIPVCAHMDSYSTRSDFPQAWLLVARKLGGGDRPRKYADKRQAIEAVIWCPRCRSRLTFAPDACTCVNCGTRFPSKHGQIDFLV